MREILFRGKETFNGEWVEGYYEFGYDAETENPTHYMWVLNHAGKYGDMFMVIPETVGQYTGLKDRHGRKIFEGDILDCGDRVVYVKWHEFCGTWDSMFIKYKGERNSNGIEVADWKYRAVIIGNIHDNPELLN